MHYLIYSAESSVTGRNLLDALKEQGVEIHGGTRLPEGQVDTLIRWGSSARVARKPVRVINRADAIQRASNKREALNIMRAARVSVPSTVSAAEVTSELFPVLGRRDHHVGGTDIILCLQKSDLSRAVEAGCTHFSEYIPTKAEYRVHVFGDQVIKTSQKILTDPTKATQPWIRNLDAGYTFRQPELRLSAVTKGMAIEAVNSLGLIFGAVDVIVSDTDQPYVLEVNSAPGLIDSSMENYLEQFKAAIR